MERKSRRFVGFAGYDPLAPPRSDQASSLIGPERTWYS